MRKMMFVFLAVFTLAQAGCRTPTRPVAAAAPHPYTRIANPDSNTVQLQIAIRKFVPARHRGPELWLVGVMHVGEPAYYQELQTYLDARTVVLYEGINPDSHPHHVHDSAPIAAVGKPPAHNSAASATASTPSGDSEGGYSMQSAMAHALGLVFQLDAIDYDRTNFLNSDLSVQQIQRVLGGGALTSPTTPSTPSATAAPGQPEQSNPSFDALLQIMDGSSFLGSLFKFGLQFIGANPKLQATAKLTMIEAIGRLKGDLSDMRGLPPEWKQLIKVLIEARNQNVLADLQTELKKIPRSGSIAVFYGAGHMDDLEKRVTQELHYHVADEIWLPAFSVDMRKNGISPGEAQTMRNLVKWQLDQMQSP